jgi:glycosyltransferase involved in cell wall biosynthesis
LPYPIKRRITQEHKDQAKKLAHRLRTAHSKVRGNRVPILKSAIKAGEPIHFMANEQVVILGKPWDTMSMIDALRAQKLAAPFTFVHLIYDMIPVFMPHVFGQPLPTNYTTHMFEAITMADQLVAISESTKRDIQKFCKEELLPEPPITVAKLGDGFVDTTVSEDYAVPGLKPEQYILCVGTIEIRKNHILLYTAYKEALSQGKTMPKLVIVGGRGWYVEDVLYEFRHDPELKDLVNIMHKVDDRQLAWLYQNCKFTVYPSVYEGWGLPIAESLAYGKFCVASQASSMPEVAGDLIDYFSPYNSAQCAELIRKYLDPVTLANKQTEIQNKYQPASWSQTFEQFVKVLS